MGKIGERLKHRINQHKLIIKKKTGFTALAEHSIKNNHAFNFKKTEILLPKYFQ